jgi:hypothetical protein
VLAVEVARQQLYDLQNKHGFGHASVLKQSMVLGEKLVMRSLAHLLNT